MASAAGSNIGSRNGSRMGSNMGSRAGSVAGSKMGSAMHSRQGSVTNFDFGDSKGPIQPGFSTSLMTGRDEEDEDDVPDMSNKKGATTLVSLAARHREELAALQAQSKKEINDSMLAYEAREAELEEIHTEESAKLLEDQERELSEMRAIQEKEIAMEESMHDSEMKMLIERRILNSVLQTVNDGIYFCFLMNHRYCQYYPGRDHNQIQSCCRKDVWLSL